MSLKGTIVKLRRHFQDFNLCKYLWFVSTPKRFKVGLKYYENLTRLLIPFLKALKSYSF